MVVTFSFQCFYAGLGFIREEFGHNHPFIVYDTLGRAKPYHFFRLQLDRQLRGNLFRRQVKAFAGHGNGDRAHQYNGTAVELAVNSFFINTTNTSAVAIVHAIVHAERLGNDEVTAHDVDMRTLQWRVIQAHRQASRNIQLQQTCSLLHQLQGFRIRNAGMFVVNRLVVVCGQVGVDLRARAIDHHQADPEAV